MVQARTGLLSAESCHRALNARDARFDGLFFVGITSTMIYCRPVCPARVSYPERRRFFDSAAAAERAGYRPCLRCRPELAPGRALVDAVPRLAQAAAQRIAAGALNGHGVGELARELGVSSRHLRRALQRELGVSPIELAQTYRLLLARRLLTDTALPVTRIAYSSGFQSLRRFNSVFRERYRLNPSALRHRAHRLRVEGGHATDAVRLTLAYRPPFAWDALLGWLARDAIPGVEAVHGRRYGRTVELEGATGVVFAEPAATGTYLIVDASQSLLPVLMALLARLRQLFDLDAEPAVVDVHLERAGLGPLVRRHPGLRIPGAIDGFDVALRTLLGSRSARSLVLALGQPVDTGIRDLARLVPSAATIAAAGAARLVEVGVPRRRAERVTSLARAVADGTLRLSPGVDLTATYRALIDHHGVGDRAASIILMRALGWPDALPSTDRALQLATGTTSAQALRARAEQWRPWRSYAAVHLWLEPCVEACPPSRNPREASQPEPESACCSRQVSAPRIPGTITRRPWPHSTRDIRPPSGPTTR